MTTNEELIAEARERAGYMALLADLTKNQPGAVRAREEADRMTRFADALEVRQPSEEGEYILRLIETIKQTGGSVEVSGVKIMPCDEFGRTAAVPDAATERVRDAWRKDHREMFAQLDKVTAERDAVLATIDRARAVCLHLGGVDGDVSQPAPSYYVSVGRNVVATEVLAALDGAPEPETPELFPGTNAALDRLTVRKAEDANAFCIEHGNFHAVELGDPTCEFEDGFGEPVDGEQP